MLSGGLVASIADVQSENCKYPISVLCFCLFDQFQIKLEKADSVSRGRGRTQMNTIKILLNFGRNNKQVTTLPPC